MKIESIQGVQKPVPPKNVQRGKSSEAPGQNKDKDVAKENKKVKEDKTYHTIDKNRLNELLEEQSVLQNQFRRMILDLLERQGYALDSLEGMTPEEIQNLDVKVDDEARQEALQMISEDGPYGIEATSDRIVDFAKALANKNPEKIPLLRDAIEKGFEAAKSMLGGSLPDISMKTYDRVMEKLDEWEKSF